MSTFRSPPVEYHEKDEGISLQGVTPTLYETVELPMRPAIEQEYDDLDNHQTLLGNRYLEAFLNFAVFLTH